MLKIQLEGFEDLKRQLADAPKKLEIAAQKAIRKTANAIKDAEISEMKRVFDRPVSWTLGAMKVSPVKDTSKLEVIVGILDPDGYYKRAAGYLGTQIDGGRRKIKAMESALQNWGLMPKGWLSVPGEGALIDSYGNMSVGQIRQILSYFGAAERWAGSQQNMSQAKKIKLLKGSKSKLGFQYFVVLPGMQKNLKQPGIYQRISFGHGKAIKPILIYIRSAKYKPIFNFEKIAREVADEVMQPHFEDAIRGELLK